MQVAEYYYEYGSALLSQAMKSSDILGGAAKKASDDKAQKEVDAGNDSEDAEDPEDAQEGEGEQEEGEEGGGTSCWC